MSNISRAALVCLPVYILYWSSMSWGRFPGFDEDPFFTSHGHHHGFGHGFPSFPSLAISSPSQHLHQRSDRQLSMLDPFSMFSDMERMMNGSMAHHHGGGHSFSSSSVMHYSSTGGSQPKIYHAASSVTQGPGGIKETRKTESNSETGIKKMAIGHHINDRSHLIEKKHNAKTGSLEQHQELINLDESDAGSFNHEWQEKTRSFRHPLGGIKSHDRGHFADRRGLGGVPDIRTRSNNVDRQKRNHRSRSPERKGSPTLNLDDINSSSTSRRSEYLKGGGVKRDRKKRGAATRVLRRPPAARLPSYMGKYYPPKFHFKELPAERMDYFLVLDFEGVINKDEGCPNVMEIIEFPVLKINARTFETESTFHSYVQPIIHPKLNPTATEITGITQEMVDGQPTLPQVLDMLDGWMKEEGLLEERVKSCFVTCGDWDLKTGLPINCDYLKILYKDYLKKWINIKNYFQAALGKKASGMKGMLHDLHLTLDGRHHSGIDDSRNIAKILKDLAGRNEELGRGIVAPKILLQS